jgi:hypothetical protein
MTVNAIKEDGTKEIIASVTKITPIAGGAKLAIEAGATFRVIRIMDIIEITDI